MFSYLSSGENDLAGQFERMRRDLDELFGARPWSTGIRSVATGTYPAINIGAAADRVDVYLFIAGANPQGFDITVQQNLLTVAGERQAGTPEAAQFYRRERFTGPFRRVITLPDDVDPDRVEAHYRDGVLHITVARREAVKARQIEVR